MTRESKFSKAEGKRLIKIQTDKRVTEAAGIEITEELTDMGKGIAEKAKRYAEHSRRKTVRGVDMR